MKIFFGRKPAHEGFCLDMDMFFRSILETHDFDYRCAVGEFLGVYKDSEAVFYTINPMILQWLDEGDESCVYFITKDNQTIRFIDDNVCMEKYKLMGVGEVLVDDCRI